MKKFILKLDLNDDKDKRKALKTVSTLSGIDSITVNMKEKNLTIVGSVDPINVVNKLRKLWPTNLVFVGPAKEPEKKEEPKKEEKKEENKDEPKKEESKKEEDAPKEELKKEEKKSAPQEQVVGMFMPPMHTYYKLSYPPMHTYYNNQPYHQSIEENPNTCVIC